ncbi:hypothetical protein F5J12DRAFT_827067 [Pisolithus orientalis]|uniref:uncharacterized protein n=1 Tax=Pisolithus orientalis TaxID=936130 RepID=UPI002225158D|nr:uncharacterized protein F5J12DRAFT_827067 [Pisolithus orientalis]KAI6008171.1 hypothetical protein F5J12DRAFT_827067 [Pisolithus orientalis]
MHRTPWTSSGSLTSDRIPARPLPAKQQAKGRGQGPPKSKAVLALETRLHNVEYVSGKEKDPKGGCFCLGTYPIALLTTAGTILSVSVCAGRQLSSQGTRSIYLRSPLLWLRPRSLQSQLTALCLPTLWRVVP